MLIIDQFETGTFPTHAIIQEVDVYYSQEGFQTELVLIIQDFNLAVSYSRFQFSRKN